jgi:hypothetical protein
LIGQAAGAIPWRHWDDRVKLFDRLLELDQRSEHIGEITQSLTEVRDRRIVPILWKLTAREGFSESAAQAVWMAMAAVVPALNVRDPSQVNTAVNRQVTKDLTEKAKSGPEWQRVIALALLTNASIDDAATVARAMIDEPDISPELQRDAYQVYFVSLEPAKARAAAAAAIATGSSEVQKLAFKFLTSNEMNFLWLRQSLMLNQGMVMARMMTARNDDELNPSTAVPKELKAATLRPLLAAADREVSAFAAYFLCLLGESEGLEPLLKYWRTQKDSEWTKQVYQAIARLNDDAKASILEEIYTDARAKQPEANQPFHFTSNQFDMKDFYWTIRPMKGAKAVALRKRIRREVGMEALRGEITPSLPMPVD